jgi:hypothetical protein
MRSRKFISMYALAAILLTGLNVCVRAGSLDQMQNALIYLQKARMTSAVQQKTDSLKKAKGILLLVKADTEGYRDAAVALTMQAIARVGEFKLDKANMLIDMAIVKVKHGIQAMKQKSQVNKKKTPSGK